MQKINRSTIIVCVNSIESHYQMPNTYPRTHAVSSKVIPIE